MYKITAILSSIIVCTCSLWAQSPVAADPENGNTFQGIPALMINLNNGDTVYYIVNDEFRAEIDTNQIIFHTSESNDEKQTSQDSDDSGEIVKKISYSIEDVDTFRYVDLNTGENINGIDWIETTDPIVKLQQNELTILSEISENICRIFSIDGICIRDIRFTHDMKEDLSKFSSGVYIVNLNDKVVLKFKI